MRRATTLAGLPKLETFAQAEARNLQRVDVLTDRAPEIGAALEACDPAVLCALIICAICSRRYRFRLIRRLLAIARSRPGRHEVATIYLGTYLAGTLATASMNRERDRLRKRLERAGFGESILIGGIEVNWDSAAKSWVLHVHVLAMGVRPAAWKRLKGALRGAGPKFPVKVSRLLNPERQISYMTKYHTYYRPWSRSGAARSPAVPLPRDRLAEFAEWSSHYTFDDFTFLLGAKRRGGRIVLESAGTSSNSFD
jgi:hypothetical protein